MFHFPFHFLLKYINMHTYFSLHSFNYEKLKSKIFIHSAFKRKVMVSRNNRYFILFVCPAIHPWHSISPIFGSHHFGSTRNIYSNSIQDFDKVLVISYVICAWWYVLMRQIYDLNWIYNELNMSVRISKHYFLSYKLNSSGSCFFFFFF